MTNSKGAIDLKAVDTKNGLRLIKELITKCSSDALNVKKEEFAAVLDLVDEIEKRLVDLDSNTKKAKLYGLVEKDLSATQLRKLLGKVF